ncbi:hypothetical protein EDB86DRAFT_3075679 [Lactarius hatsudake]|nr:hypothetical protein EDB86DRAFT_3075679 [Lactarius hatsudake]
MNKISKTRVRDSVEMTVFGFSHVGLFDVDDKCMLIISSVASAIGLFVDVWFIPTYSGADVRKFHLFLPLSPCLLLVTLFVATLALVTFEKVRGLVTGWAQNTSIQRGGQRYTGLMARVISQIVSPLWGQYLIVRLKSFTHLAVAATSQTAYRVWLSLRELLLPPLPEHTSPSEAHLYLHTRGHYSYTHTSAPFTSHQHTHGHSLILYASPDYKVAYLHIRVGWRGSLGRAGARYWTAIPGWSVGVVAWMLFSAPDDYEHGGRAAVVELLTPSVPESLSVFTRKIFPRILGVTLARSHPPLSRDYVLGNGGKVVFVPLTPLSFDRDGSSHGQSAGALRYHKETRRWHPPNHGPLVLLLVALLLPGKSRPRLPARSPRDLPDARSPAPLRHADSAPSVLAFALPFSQSQTRSLIPPADATRPNTAPMPAVWVRTLATAGL